MVLAAAKGCEGTGRVVGDAGSFPSPTPGACPADCTARDGPSWLHLAEPSGEDMDTPTVSAKEET
jgi:hypothetical protein